MIISENPQRLAIYFFFDKDGIVDRYVPFFLKELKKCVSQILVVSNGAPTVEGKRVLESYGELYIRENVGFDVWAYKEAMKYCGWESLEKYDEVILLNNTIMGPVYPLKETFDKMDQKDIDFWGMTMYFGQDYDSSGCCRYGYIPDHIQSHFIACRKSLIMSKEFQEYWENMPMINNYWEAVGKHEMVFTKYFEDMGFKSEISVDMKDLRRFNNYPLMMSPTMLMKERRCPIFKRKVFFYEPQGFLSQTAGEQTMQLFEFLKTETDYNIDYIWESILRRYNHADLVKNMNFCFVLPQKEILHEEELSINKIALILYLQYEKDLKKYYLYSTFMPIQTDVYILTDSEEKKKKAEKIFSELDCNCLNVSIVEKKQIGVATLLVEMRKEIMRYEVVCVVQDMDSLASSVILSNEQRCLESVLASKEYVINVMKVFDQNPKLGMLVPPPPNHGPYYTNIGNEWRVYYPKVRELMDELGITVPVSEGKPPICSLGTTFWFRPKALEPLYRKRWEAQDFQADNMLANVIERLYPFVVQQAGFYPGILMSCEMAQVELGNLYFYIRGFNRILMNYGIENYYQYMCEELDYIVSEGMKVPNLLEKKQNLERDLDIVKKEKEIIENLSLINTLKFWLKNKRKRMKEVCGIRKKG